MPNAALVRIPVSYKRVIEGPAPYLASRYRGEDERDLILGQWARFSFQRFPQHQTVHRASIQVLVEH